MDAITYPCPELNHASKGGENFDMLYLIFTIYLVKIYSKGTPLPSCGPCWPDVDASEVVMYT